ncbi:hypothetical protein KZO01_22480 [Kurthia zopfii]|uniref:Protein of uncharacterized function (DUF3006) n=1 Tax=Kurthia zopfii TaxID=1650 RepID=A0A2U3ADF1_9BACL|nr:DUF3006 domain-containing protein [Kurthia zopfii]PWI22557.1 DUF3006 domain-containing protein [Kurthia zopfii]TDR39013.1 hypothetical protein DFR61_1137 [Kurthia zopfii]STX09549.1 Protein of uncharacterised function (DUF3006) [Kurthia zopfii]VEI06720.1 Protein of uncharacterised function (DUF3006) [Kurthia zopfii]GEK31939.1 hypothetical protein KZO01_22480 [Kurthia zopfii]
MVKGIIDRFEGDFVIIEMSDSGLTKDFPIANLQSDLQVGDVVEIDEALFIKKDELSTIQKKAEIEQLMDDLFED